MTPTHPGLRLKVWFVLFSLTAVVALGGILAPTALAKNGQQVTAQFGEPQGSTLSRCDPQHRFAENPGPVDKKSLVTFALNHLPEGTVITSFAAPPSCMPVGTVACSGASCDAAHQVIILKEGIGHDDAVLPAPVPGNAFIFTGSGITPTPGGWLDPSVDPLPENVLAAGSFREDYSYTFDKTGKYLVLCNLRSHYDAGMWVELEVDNINLNKGS